VTAVVVATNGAAPGASQAFVDELRRQMRQSDVVGVLRPGEVGLLLPDTTAAHAAAVAKRLRAALTAIAASRSSIRAIGFATRMPGEGVAEGILNDARANAMRRAGNGAVHSAAS
jgi:GGDEF domain-containing protein